MKRRYFFVIALILILFNSCNRTQDYLNPEQTSFLDLDELREKGKITAVTDFNSTNYFLYRGEPMGFHYELLKSFSEYIGLSIEIVAENDINKAQALLNSGKADLMAIDLAVTASRKDIIKFSEPVLQTRQVLVQRKPNRWSSMKISDIENSLIRNQLDLSGKTIYVRAGSSAVENLKNLSALSGDSIGIIEVPIETEELIALVARREIDYAVCDENIARVNAQYHSIIDVETPVSFIQNMAWGLRKEKSDQLKKALDAWLNSLKSNDSYALLYAKYFRNSWSAYRVRNDYYTLSTGRVSEWDMIIKSFSDTIKWDWRLLASLIYQESRFKPTVTSWAGAYGLMQLMPSTGKKLGIDIKSSPENNIKAGVTYIKYLQDFFSDKIPDENERLKFILASYNAGAGNVLDAMRLAEKHGGNPLVWEDNVAYYLLKKKEPLYYNDPVVQNGYCRGDEPVNFVAQILERYSDYRSIIPESSN